MTILRQYARDLRKNQTDPEGILWSILRNKQIADAKFRRQVPIDKYIVDFICFEHKLIVEVDGSQHDEQAQKQYDIIRTSWFESQGFRVLRFWNNDIFDNIEG